MGPNAVNPARPIPQASSASGATLAATDLARLGPRASWRGRYVILRAHARGGLGTVSVALDETLDIGEDTGTPVSEDYHVPFKFTGTLNRVLIRLSDAELSAADQEQIRRARAAIHLRE